MKDFLKMVKKYTSWLEEELGYKYDGWEMNPSIAALLRELWVNVDLRRVKVDKVKEILKSMDIPEYSKFIRKATMLLLEKC